MYEEEIVTGASASMGRLESKPLLQDTEVSLAAIGNRFDDDGLKLLHIPAPSVRLLWKLRTPIFIFWKLLVEPLVYISVTLKKVFYVAVDFFTRGLAYRKRICWRADLETFE